MSVTSRRYSETRHVGIDSLGIKQGSYCMVSHEMVLSEDSIEKITYNTSQIYQHG